MLQNQQLRTLLKLVFVAALMFFVLSQTSLRDSYEIRTKDNALTTREYGRIVGAWDASVVSFLPEGASQKVLLHAGEQSDSSKVVILPGLVTYARNTDPQLFLIGALCYLLAATFAITRWWWLLKTNNLPVGYWAATRFSWIGIFFNNIVPGQTGGDLIKAVYVMKRCPGERPAALVSVIVDRVMGLGSLSLLAAGAVLFYLDDPEFQLLAFAIWSVLLLVLLLGVMAFSRRVRNLIRLSALLQKLPGGFRQVLERLDQAVFFYRAHKLGMFLWMLGGMASHAVNVLCIYFIGEALGMSVGLANYYVLVPVILIVSAIPIGPNGWGVGELMFGYLFPKYAVSAATAATAPTMYTRAVSLSLLYRIHLTLWSLLGGLTLALTKDRVTRQDVEDEVALEAAEQAGEMSETTQISGDGAAPAG